MTLIDTVVESGEEVRNLSVTIEALADGGYVTAWTNLGVGLVIQRFDPNGIPVGDEVILGSTGSSAPPNIVALSDGGFVVAFQGTGIEVARFDAQGNLTFSANRVADPAQINSFDDIDIVALGDGGYVVFGGAIDRSESRLLQQRFDANNNALGDPEVIDSVDSSASLIIEAVATTDGGYLVSYHSNNPDLTATVQFDVNGEEIGRLDGVAGREEVLQLINGNIVVIDNFSGSQATSFQILDADFNVIADQPASSLGAAQTTFVNGAGVALDDGSFVIFRYTSTDDSFFGTGNSVNGVRYAADGTVLGSIIFQLPPFDDTTSQLARTDVGVDATLLPNGNIEVIFFQNDRIFVQVVPGDDLPIDGQQLRVGVGSVTAINDDGLQIIGTLGDEGLVGGSGNDIIRGLDGNDTLSGSSGNDTIIANDGNDELFGDTGDDQLFGLGGNSSIFGGEGNDTLVGNEGSNILDGGAGDDSLMSVSSNDLLIGGTGNDTITSNNSDVPSGLVSIDPGSGNDSIVLNGERPISIITFSGAGDAGNDTIEGFTGGLDRIEITGIGTPLTDLVFNQIGNDTLVTVPNGDSILFINPVVAPTINDFSFTGEGEFTRISGDTDQIDTTFNTVVGDTVVSRFSVAIEPLIGGGFVTIISNSSNPLTAQRFDVDGTPTGDELNFSRFAFNATATADGGFVVTGADINRFDADGNSVLSIGNSTIENEAAVVRTDDGGFVVFFLNFINGSRILLRQQYGADNNPIGDPEIIEENPGVPRLAATVTGDGGYVVAFSSPTITNGSQPSGVILYSSDGQEISRVNGVGANADIAVLPNGNIVLVSGGPNSLSRVNVTVLDADLNILVETTEQTQLGVGNSSLGASVAVLEDGSFIVLHNSLGQRFSPDGSQLGERFIIERPPFEPEAQQLGSFSEGNDVTVQENGSIEVVFFQNERVFVQTLNIEDLPTGGRIQIFGDEFDNDLIGDDFSEQLFGRDGNDTLDGGLGDDTLNGGAGADVFVIGANAGSDTILDFNPSEDILDIGEIGATFDDLVIVAEGNNTRITGPNGLNVVLLGVSPTDITDSVFDFGFDSEVVGGDGDETIVGTDGRDNNDGAGGDDDVGGAEDNDSLQGGAGNDTLRPGTGSDTVDGGDGNDTIDVGDIPPDENGDGVEIDLGNGTGTGPDGDDVIINVENANGTDGDDTLIGDDGPNRLDGRGGDDVIDGAGGNDTLIGGSGNDAVTGGDGNDSIDGGVGNDVLNGNAGNDTLSGGAGDDIVNGDEGNDVINGNAGNDSLVGGDGDDVLGGGPGNDTLDGQAGNDTLIGGSGNDLLTGGTGMDTFVFGSTSGDDIITDFEQGVDTIDLSGFGPIDVDDLDIVQNGNDVVITLPNGATVTVDDASASDFTSDDFAFGNPTDEIPVNSFTDGIQGDPSIAAFGSNAPAAVAGGHIVVYESDGQDGDGNGIFARFFNMNGVPIGSEHLINIDSIVGNQIDPDVAVLNDGTFVVTWVGGDVNGSPTVFARRFEFDGNEVNPLGGEIIVSTNTAGLLSAGSGRPSVIALQSGGFAIQYTGEQALLGQGFTFIYDADGNLVTPSPITDLFPASTAESIVELSNGNILIAEGETVGDGDTTIVTIVDAMGNIVAGLGPLVPVSTLFSDVASNVTFAALDNGGFIVAYQDRANIIGRSFNADGSPASQAFTIGSSAVSGSDADPTINVLNDGTIVVTYTSSFIDGDGLGVVAQRFTTQGQLIDDPVLVNNSSIIGDQVGGEAVVNANGDLVITFSSNDDVFARTIDFDAVDPAVDLIGSGTLTGGNGDDTLSAGTQNDIIEGNSGRDVISGNGGNDTIFGGFGADSITDTGGFNVIDAGPGDDIIILTNSINDLSGGDGFDQVIVNASRLRLSGGLPTEDSIEVIDGSSQTNFDIEGSNSAEFFDFTNVDIIGDALIEAMGGNDTIVGTGGNDNIDAGSGSDSVFGGAGNDTIVGGPFNGVDIIDGGEGDDLLSGGPAADRFIFGENSGHDTITDFEAGSDVIDLGALALSFSNLVIEQVDTNTVITLSVGNTITLTDVDASTIDQNDFLF